DAEDVQGAGLGVEGVHGGLAVHDGSGALEEVGGATVLQVHAVAAVVAVLGDDGDTVLGDLVDLVGDAGDHLAGRASGVPDVTGDDDGVDVLGHGLVHDVVEAREVRLDGGVLPGEGVAPAVAGGVDVRVGE